MHFYDDPLRPDCRTSADGIDCDDKAAEKCDSELFLSIQTVDRSVHIIKTFDLPVPASLAGDTEQQAMLADMFAVDQQPAVVVATNIATHNCRDAAHVGNAACAAEAHGRHRAQAGRACPVAEFASRDVELREACGLAADLSLADVALSGDCPSAGCAGVLVGMLSDCAETV